MELEPEVIITSAPDVRITLSMRDARILRDSLAYLAPDNVRDMLKWQMGPSMVTEELVDVHYKVLGGLVNALADAWESLP